LSGELWRAHHALLDAVGSFVNDGLHAGRAVSAQKLGEAMAVRQCWQAEVTAALAEVDVLALPTLVGPPPLFEDVAGFPLTRLTAPFNLAECPPSRCRYPRPAFAVPVSLQLVGPTQGEDLLCATGLAIEAALNQMNT
jgi:amidase